MEGHLHDLVMPPIRGVCWSWQWSLLAPFVFGNLLTWSAYYFIPWHLWRVAHGRPGKWLTSEVRWGALFIFLCGTTHLLAVLLVWLQVYPLAVLTDFATGVVSWRFALLLRRKVAHIVAAPDVQEIAANKLALEERLGRLESDPRYFTDEDRAAAGQLRRTLQILDRALVTAGASAG